MRVGSLRCVTKSNDAVLPEDEIRTLFWQLLAMSRRAQLDA